jgi:hypothetical protein
VPVLAGGFANILGQERASTLEDERQEVVTSVLTALAGGPWDPDQMAACGYLLKHLADAVGRDAPPRA